MKQLFIVSYFILIFYQSYRFYELQCSTKDRKLKLLKILVAVAIVSSLVGSYEFIMITDTHQLLNKAITLLLFPMILYFTTSFNGIRVAQILDKMIEQQKQSKLKV